LIFITGDFLFQPAVGYQHEPWLVGRVLTAEIMLLHWYTRRAVGKLTDLQAHFGEWMTFTALISPFAVILHPNGKFFRRVQHVYF